MSFHLPPQSQSALSPVLTASAHKAPVIIAIASPKGGAGKTTLAINLTAAFVRLGWHGLVYDLDPAQEAVRWAINTAIPERPSFEFLSHIIPSIRQEQEDGQSLNVDILHIARKHEADIIIVDCPSTIDASVMHALQLAQLVLVPTALSALDLERTSLLMGRLETLKAEGEAIPEVMVVPVLLSGQTSPSELALLARQAVLAPTLHRRPDFLDVLAPEDSAGEAEISAIARSVLAELWLGQRKESEAPSRTAAQKILTEAS